MNSVKRRIAINIGGGYAPGLNSVVAGTVLAASELGWEVVGIRDGFDGLLFPERYPDGGTIHLTASLVECLSAAAGAALGTNPRSDPFRVRTISADNFVEEVDRSDELIQVMRDHEIEGVVSVVSSRALSVVFRLHRKGLNAVCIPKSAENDIAATQLSFGFNSALSFTLDILERARTAAHSAGKIGVVGVPGEHAGWLALQAGMTAGADAVLIPEIPYDLTKVAEKLQRKMNGGRGYALVVVADGAVSATPTGSQPEHPLKKSLAPLASNVIRELLGDYAKTADPTLLLSKKSDGIPNNVARLAGARFVSTSETESGRRLDETQVKQLTGGDRIAARFLYAEFFEFAALFKLFLATNHRPKIRGTDNGIWRRIRLVPFNVTIPDEQQDKELKDKLRNELPGILAWAVRGSLAWQKQGLGIPPEVREATESYRCDMDVVGTFISERCIQKAGIKTPVSKLYGEYVAWCEENGEEPLKKGDFGHHMSAHGFSDDRDGRTRYRVGIGLVTDVTDYDAHFSDSSEFEQSVPNLSKQSSQASPSSQPMEAEVEVEL